MKASLERSYEHNTSIILDPHSLASWIIHLEPHLLKQLISSPSLITVHPSYFILTTSLYVYSSFRSSQFCCHFPTVSSKFLLTFLQTSLLLGVKTFSLTHCIYFLIRVSCFQLVFSQGASSFLVSLIDLISYPGFFLHLLLTLLNFNLYPPPTFTLSSYSLTHLPLPSGTSPLPQLTSHPP